MAAAAVVSSNALSPPFPMSSHQRPHNASKVPPQPPPGPSRAQPSSSAIQPESSARGFGRLRSSLEQSLRTATRSRKQVSRSSIDDFATVTPKTTKGKEKEKDTSPSDEGHKEKHKMLRRLESKVTFRRSGRESTTPAPTPVPPSPVPMAQPAGNSKRVGSEDTEVKVRKAGFTSYITPSLRQASMSSPALHLSSQAMPSPGSQPLITASSSSPTSVLVSPTRERSRRASHQSAATDIASPMPQTPRRDHGSRMSSGANVPSSSSRFHHKPSKSTPAALPIPQQSHLSEPPETPLASETLSPPDTPTPQPRGHLTRASRSGSKSSTYLPISTGPPPSPTTPRATSPLHARSSSRARATTPTSPRLNSPSTSHLVSSPTISARRPSVDSQRPSTASGSGSALRGTSSSPVRPRPISPSQRTYAQNRHFNASTTSLSGTTPPEHSEAIRVATTLLCRELARPPVRQTPSDTALKEWKEVDVRMQPLIRLERIWGKSGGTGMASSSSISGGQMTSTGFSASGEERLRRLFCEALRDGYVLCHLINKLRASSVVKPDPREDGFVRTTNVTKFLAACASYGLPTEDLFQRDDLIEGSSESLTRVARTIGALVKFADDPSAADRSRFLMKGQGHRVTPPALTPPNGPYGHRNAASSTPNLNIAQRAASPPGIGLGVPSSPTRTKRYNPSPSLPPVRSDSPDESQGSGESITTGGPLDIRRSRSRDGTPSPLPPVGRSPSGSNNGYLPPPPRSPLRPVRSRPSFEDNDGLYAGGLRASIADSTRASVGDYSVADRESILSLGAARQSRATSMMSDSTNQTEYSSLLDAGRGYGHVARNGSAAGRPPSHGSGYNKFATVRTMTTEATSEAPSFGRADGTSVAGSICEDGQGRPGSGKNGARERKLSEAQVVDLSRVAEETEESGSSSRGGGKKSKEKEIKTGGGMSVTERDREREAEAEKSPVIRLGKGKWPDDFLDALQAHNCSGRPSTARSPVLDDDEVGVPSGPPTPLSISPPRKISIITGSRRSESVESLPQFPRRPSHRARHSIDTPGLLPKEVVLRRDTSPEGISPSGRIMLRRHSTKQGLPPRSGSAGGIYLPRGMDERGSSGDSGDVLVPFPRTVSGEHGATPSPRPSSGEDQQAGGIDKPRPLRGRFQSDVHGESARRRTRPNSYDELGVKPGATRNRFESMVNLGAPSNSASASDLMARDSMDGSGVRKALIIREEGKPPTHFQLGNCIGRGQFGSVYRALNLNTGQMVAVKRIRLEGLKEDEVTQLMREVDLVKSLSHPSIVKYEGMARDEDTLSIVLEYAESGSLVQTLKAFGKLNESLVAGYVVKILEGLHYLHQSDVVHCDLKAANILTTKTGNVKLADFGVSLNLRAMEREIKDVAGTPNWMAPEVIELKGASTKSDIWSLGCVVIELLTGRPPYAEIANSMTVMFRIVEDETPPIPDGISPLCQDFLSSCFNKDPNLRPDAETLCEHPWLKHNWGAFKELRPQDSIPFLRRVSQDLAQKSDALRYLANLDLPDTPVTADYSRRSDELLVPSPVIGRRTSHSSVRPSTAQDGELAPREHNFVKTSFSKPVVCRVCLLNVKKSAVLCAQCSLIAHSKCTPSAPPTCDLRATLLAMAEYADKGHPFSEYSNPIEYSNAFSGPASDVSYVAHSPRTSLDMATPPQSPPNTSQGPNPPTAFKFMAAFKRSRSSLTPEPGQPSPTSPTSLVIPLGRGKSVARARERPQSLSSTSTNPGTSSMRSAATAAESFSSRNSRQEQIRKSALPTDDRDDTDTRASVSQYSGVGEDGSRMSKTTSQLGSSRAEHDTMVIPGEMPMDRHRFRRHSHSRDSKSSNNNCTIQ